MVRWTDSELAKIQAGYKAARKNLTPAEQQKIIDDRKKKEKEKKSEKKKTITGTTSGRNADAILRRIQGKKK